MRKKVVVLIDCWDFQNTDHKRNKKNNFRRTAFKHIQHFVENTKIHLVVDSIYDEEPHPNIQKLIERHNVKKILELQPFVRKIFSDQSPIDLYYMGMHWNVCIRDRPVGWSNILSYISDNNIDCRILFKENTIVAYDEKEIEHWPNFEQDKRTLCSKINDTTWQLLGPRT